jgi:predicted PurR-regulated permease PerM
MTKRPEVEHTVPENRDSTTYAPPVRLGISEKERERQWRALSVFAIAACLIIVWMAMPVGIGIFLGTLTAFALQPLYRNIRARTESANLAAGLCTALATIGIAVGMAGISYLLIGRGVGMTQSLLAAVGPNGAAQPYVEKFATKLTPFISPDDLTAKLHDAASNLVSRSALAAAVVAQATFTGLLGFFFAVLTIYFVLRNWSRIERRAEEMLPLDRRHTHALFEEFRVVGRTSLLGTVVAGIVQGVFATIGYWISGVPNAAFFGAATAVASLLPGVGTLLVWVPAGVYLMATGHVAHGILELAFGAVVVVGITDYVIRPRLVGGHGNMPALLTFASLFGGVEVFGLVGLVLGPLLMSVAVSLLRIYLREGALRNGAAGSTVSVASTEAAPVSVSSSLPPASARTKSEMMGPPRSR